MSRRWVDGPLCGFDTETSGTDVTRSRIVTAAIILIRPAGALDDQRPTETFSWLVNPGVPIPAEATAIHGITDAQAAEGANPADALREIAGLLAGARNAGAPVIGYNACFDLSLLAHELARHGLPALEVGHVVDPLVIDRAVDKYRKGSRKLADVCKHYGVPLGADAHGAEADTRATMRLAWRLAQTFPALVGELSLAELHEAQVGWQQSWADHYAEYLRTKGGQPDAVIDGSWPVRLAAESNEAAA